MRNRIVGVRARFLKRQNRLALLEKTHLAVLTINLAKRSFLKAATLVSEICSRVQKAGAAVNSLIELILMVRLTLKKKKMTKDI